MQTAPRRRSTTTTTTTTMTRPRRRTPIAPHLHLAGQRRPQRQRDAAGDPVRDDGGVHEADLQEIVATMIVELGLAERVARLDAVARRPREGLLQRVGAARVAAHDHQALAVEARVRAHAELVAVLLEDRLRQRAVRGGRRRRRRVVRVRVPDLVAHRAEHRGDLGHVRDPQRPLARSVKRAERAQAVQQPQQSLALMLWMDHQQAEVHDVNDAIGKTNRQPRQRVEAHHLASRDVAADDDQAVLERLARAQEHAVLERPRNGGRGDEADVDREAFQLGVAHPQAGAIVDGRLHIAAQAHAHLALAREHASNDPHRISQHLDAVPVRGHSHTRWRRRRGW
jgi:hypothetical protein